MSDLLLYRYFAGPYAFSTYSPVSRTCDLCGSYEPGYGGPFAGGRRDEPKVAHVCEDCMRLGKLASRGLAANLGNRIALRDQLSDRFRNAPRDQLMSLVAQRTAELEHRTPPLVSWQPLVWPAHCGDYCRYLKEAGRSDLVLLAPDRDGRAFLAAHGHGIAGPDHANELWGRIRPDAPSNIAVAYATGVYLFRCLECARHVILWDRD
jgi:uncharacterized protein CbrC (UPF0167 family)